MFAGLQVVSATPLTAKEGGGPSLISLVSTVPVLCAPQDRAFGECCVHLELAMTALDQPQRCPAGNIVDRVSSNIFQIEIYRPDITLIYLHQLYRAYIYAVGVYNNSSNNGYDSVHVNP